MSSLAMGAPADGRPPVRVVGPAALKALMAYGGTVLDLRPELEAGAGPGAEGALVERLACRLAHQGAQRTATRALGGTPGSDAPADLILLLADDLEAGTRVAAQLQLDGYTSVVVVNAGPGPAAAVPDETPG
ncbi:MAG: hypothetical protein ACO3FA_01905 [Vulcanococcus sp.]